MKFFNWMHNKLNGGQGSKKSNATPITTNHKNEEFKDWPDSLLAIGTFGNRSSDLKEQSKLQVKNYMEDEDNDEEQTYSSPDLAEFTPEEVGKLQKELTKLLSRKPAPTASGAVKSKLVELNNNNNNNNNNNDILPLDKFLNCPSSLEVDRRINSSKFSSTNYSDDFDYEEEEIDRTIRVIIDRCKDVCSKQNKKKLISFLLKKMFVCTNGGFAPAAPSLRDTFPESRMEKLLRTMLSKKLHPQNAPRTSTKRYLEDKNPQSEEQEEKKCYDGSKWVKTDSDFIVLEM